jgi:hypothetical protein
MGLLELEVQLAAVVHHPLDAGGTVAFAATLKPQCSTTGAHPVDFPFHGIS